MKIGELFVNLGVKGNDSAAKALKGVKSGLGEVKGMAFETKAMIAAVVYGLEKLMSQSAQAGTGFSQFTALTDIGAQDLQKWQYAMRQTGGSAEELTGNMKAVQATMTNMLLGKGAPEGLAMVANKVGLDPKRMRDTLYAMEQLQKFANAVPKDVGNPMLKSFGLSDGTISAMRKNAFRPDVFAKAPTYSDKEIGQLNKVDVAWGNLGQKIQMAMGHLTSKHGMTLVKDVDKLATSILRLMDALVKLGEQTKILEKFGKLVDLFSDMTGEASGYATGKRSFLGEDLDKNGNVIKKHATGGFMKQLLTEQHAEKYITDWFKGMGAPAGQTGGSQTVEVNQTLNFQHDGKDAKKTSDSVNKAVKDAFRQMSAQAQGT